MFRLFIFFVLLYCLVIECIDTIDDVLHGGFETFLKNIYLKGVKRDIDSKIFSDVYIQNDNKVLAELNSILSLNTLKDYSLSEVYKRIVSLQEQPVNIEIEKCENPVRLNSLFAKKLKSSSIPHDIKKTVAYAIEILTTSLRKKFKGSKPFQHKTEEDVRLVLEKIEKRLKGPTDNDDFGRIGKCLHRSESTLVPVPFPHIVPGERFNEFYYWDSHWILGGLGAVGSTDLMQEMFYNYLYLIDNFGFIPNGAREYYLDRSQPPMVYRSFSLLKSIIDMNEDGDKTRREILVNALPRMIDDFFGFWLNPRGKHLVSFTSSDDPEEAQRCVSEYMRDGISGIMKFVRANDKHCHLLFRYYSPCPIPRLESFFEDMAAADSLQTTAGNTADKEALWTGIRAAAESGWDFSTRWNKRSIRGLTVEPGKFFVDLRTQDVIPIDLNALLVEATTILADSIEEFIGKDIKSFPGVTNFLRLFSKRTVESLYHVGMLNDYRDYDFVDKAVSRVEHGGSLFACEILKIENHNCLRLALTDKNGNAASKVASQQQWDHPNVWAPLQGFVYDDIVISQKGSCCNSIPLERFIASVGFFKEAHKLFMKNEAFYEKYAVSSHEGPGSGGEYSVQKGFGWTNGLLLQVFTYAPEELLLGKSVSGFVGHSFTTFLWTLFICIFLQIFLECSLTM